MPLRLLRLQVLRSAPCVPRGRERPLVGSLCLQEAQVTRQKSPPAENDAVVAYIDAAADPARTRLRRLRSLVRKEAPNAVERMAYGLPTWHQEEDLLHLGAFARHVGLYPGPAAIEAF